MAWSAPVTHVTGYVVTASDWNVNVNDLLFLYGDTSWTGAAGVTFTNSWADFGGNNLFGFRLLGTRVVCRGAIKSGTLNTAAFTFPVNYRPATDTYNFVITSAGNTTGYSTVTTAGVYTPIAGTNTFMDMSQVTFDTI